MNGRIIVLGTLLMLGCFYTGSAQTVSQPAMFKKADTLDTKRAANADANPALFKKAAPGMVKHNVKSGTAASSSQNNTASPAPSDKQQSNAHLMRAKPTTN